MPFDVLPIYRPGVDFTDEEVRRFFQSLLNALNTNAAPNDAPYLTWKASTDLTADQNLGLLLTGYLKTTQAAGVSTVSSVAAIPGTDITGAALSKTDDTNVTLTLGGSFATALLRAASLTLGWTGLLGLARGGTNANLSATGGTGQVLKQSTAGGAVTVGTLPASDIASGAALTRVDDTNVTATLGGTPASALLKAVSITLGWTGLLSVARGGTGLGTLTAHALYAGNGTSAPSAIAVGTTGQVLVGNTGADPSFSASPVVTSITSGAFTASAPATYTTSNVSTSRSFDANTVTVHQLADVVGTLIADLRALGLVA